MKKILSTAIALGLVAGVASSASAAFDKFETTGYFYVQGIKMYQGDAAGVDLWTASEKDNNGDWWRQKLRLNSTLTINDKSKIVAEIRQSDDHIWGNQAGGDAANALFTDGMSQVRIDKLYAEYESPIGRLRLGRIPWATYGTDFVNSESRNNGFVFWPNFVPKPFSLILVHSKLTEEDGTGNVASRQGANHEDSEYTDIRFEYKTDTINAGTRLGLTDNDTTETVSIETWRWGGFGDLKFGNFFVKGEWDYLFGDVESDASTGNSNYDTDAWAYMLSGGGKFGNLDAELMYFHLDGEDGANDREQNAYGSVGNDFEPLMILTGSLAGLLNQDLGGGEHADSLTSVGVTAGATPTFDGGAGVDAIVARFGFAVNDKLALSSAIGYAWADEENNLNNRANYDDEYGWEIDLGLEYKLLDNLTYSANFGYWDAGDFFDRNSTLTTDNMVEDNVYILTHKLNMAF